VISNRVVADNKACFPSVVLCLPPRLSNQRKLQTTLRTSLRTQVHPNGEETVWAR